MFCQTNLTKHQPQSALSGRCGFILSLDDALEGRISLTKTALPKRPKEGAREWKGSIVSAAKSRLDAAETHPAAAPPQ